LSSIAGGATLILQARFDPVRSARLMDRLRPTVAPMVPMMFEQLCQEMERRGRAIKGLRFCFSGSAALSVDLKNEFQERTGALVLEGYGLSEASPVTHVNPPNDRAIAGSIGIPLPGTQAKIVDKDTGTRPVKMGDVGELAIQGPQVMQGYLNSPEETAETLRDGWLHTGDLAQMDENGYFTIVDRKKDMIISGGFNVYPNEVEAALVSHPDVGEAAVVGLPDRVYGERVAAFVTVKSGRTIDTTSLRFYCGTQIAKYKVPHSIEVVNELPKSFLGKTLRTELRNRAA
jgi:long-chain acyl-CoA synthetase